MKKKNQKLLKKLKKEKLRRIFNSRILKLLNRKWRLKQKLRRKLTIGRVYLRKMMIKSKPNKIKIHKNKKNKKK